jgi:hypothetical protein
MIVSGMQRSEGKYIQIVELCQFAQLLAKLSLARWRRRAGGWEGWEAYLAVGGWEI